MRINKNLTLSKLTSYNQSLLGSFLNKQKHLLSAYSFANIYIWKDIFDFYWEVFEGALFIYAKYGSDIFMYIPPVGSCNIKKALKISFNLMKAYNKNAEAIRIENVEEKNTSLFKELGYKITLKGHEYIYDTRSLIDLKGNAFKGKRSSCNYFVKNYKYSYEAFNKKYEEECLSLYKKWQFMRSKKYKSPYYLSLLDDSFLAHKCAISNFKRLKLIGRIIRIKGRLKAYTFGFRLNEDIFCILFETADLSIKGVSQFIFREFCGELKDYKFINTLDDSGLDNLKKTKLSYKPAMLVPSYTATLQN